jgi:hypothetical protein
MQGAVFCTCLDGSDYERRCVPPEQSKIAFPNFGTTWDTAVQRSDPNLPAAWQSTASRLPSRSVAIRLASRSCSTSGEDSELDNYEMELENQVRQDVRARNSRPFPLDDLENPVEFQGMLPSVRPNRAGPTVKLTVAAATLTRATTHSHNAQRASPILLRATTASLHVVVHALSSADCTPVRG